MINFILFILLGVFAGTISGVVGIGGGVIIVPALLFLFGFTQQQAQGTTLALLIPPIGLLAAYNYFKGGYVDMKVAILICLGFFVGGFFGSKLAVNLPGQTLQKVFGCVVMFIGTYMLIKK